MSGIQGVQSTSAMAYSSLAVKPQPVSSAPASQAEVRETAQAERQEVQSSRQETGEAQPGVGTRFSGIA